MVLDTTADNSIPFSMNVPAFNCSEEARLLADTPLTELSSETRIKLSEMLNGRKILRHAGHDRDWRGIAELAKVSNFCSTNSNDPMQTVLSQWCHKNSNEATFCHLLYFLSKIDRWDVSDDIFTSLIKDARIFECRRSYANAASGISSENTTFAGSGSIEENDGVSNGNCEDESDVHENSDESDNDANADGGGSSSSPSPTPSPPPSPPPNLESLIERVELLTNANTPARVIQPTLDQTRKESLAVAVAVQSKQPEPEPIVDEVNALTRQDAARLRRGLPLTKYDAFVLYADPDQDYANELQQKLEKYTEFSFELVFKNRDLLGGTFFHDAVTELIEDRCNYVLLIVTRNFSRDFESCFFFNNTQSLQLKENRRRIIPLLYDLHLPRALRGLHTLKYNSEHFWDLLTDSLSVKVPPLLTKVTEHKDNTAVLPSMPKPPDTPIADNEQKSKSKTTGDKPVGKKKLLKKPEWIKKKKVQK